jgi:hypothetical protein
MARKKKSETTSITKKRVWINKEHVPCTVGVLLEDYQVCHYCEHGWTHKVGTCPLCGEGPCPYQWWEYDFSVYPDEEERKMRLSKMFLSALRAKFKPNLTYDEPQITASYGKL